MFYIRCPYTHEYHSEEEFKPCGQAQIRRAESPVSTSDEQWGDYLFFRDNIRGVHHEMWMHLPTRRYFNVTRHTVTNEILETWRIGEEPRYRTDGRGGVIDTQADNDGEEVA
ncbi:sarcosine oxidase subunit delta [Kushneria phosphatilytica]|uniref:Sarcosine oxidase subunit delta n=1 Tax=Kushneria phosphatilytica TaxID=657387 RepID=A0A5C1A0L9_9GAMM|nr:sarcosine oxidase subunit delta [Kushneria phosphatilytica]QEL10619.1 sarcosine oxidase subunit delta [Kushneria phosphatilytica]